MQIHGRTGAGLLLLLVQLVTWSSTIGVPKSKRNAVASTGPKAILEELLISKHGNNTQLRGCAIAEDPGKIRSQIMEILQNRNTAPERSSRSSNSDQQTDQSETMILNLNSVNDLNHLDQLSVIEYEPLKITAARQRKSLAAASDPVEVTATQTQNAGAATKDTSKMYYNDPQNAKTRKNFYVTAAIATPRYYLNPAQRNLESTENVEPTNDKAEENYPTTPTRVVRPQLLRNRSQIDSRVSPSTLARTGTTRNFENTPNARITPSHKSYSVLPINGKKSIYPNDRTVAVAPPSDNSYSTKKKKHRKRVVKYLPQDSVPRENLLQINAYNVDLPPKSQLAPSNVGNQNSSRRFGLLSKYDIAPRPFSIAKAHPTNRNEERSASKLNTNEERLASNADHASNENLYSRGPKGLNRNDASSSAGYSDAIPAKRLIIPDKSSHGKVVETYFDGTPSPRTRLEKNRQRQDTPTEGEYEKFLRTDEPEILKRNDVPAFKAYENAEAVVTPEEENSPRNPSRRLPYFNNLSTSSNIPIKTLTSGEDGYSETKTPISSPQLSRLTSPTVVRYATPKFGPADAKAGMGDGKMVERIEIIKNDSASGEVMEETVFPDKLVQSYKGGQYGISVASEEEEESIAEKGTDGFDRESDALKAESGEKQVDANRDRYDEENRKVYSEKNRRVPGKNDDRNGEESEQSHETLQQEESQDHGKTHEMGGGGGSDGGGKGGKGEGGDKSFVKGGGSEYDSEHRESEGDKGHKTYKSWHEHDKANKGHHDKERKSNYYDEKDGKEKKQNEEGGYYGEYEGGEKGLKEAEFGEKGEHQKGHSTKGQHFVHKKDEFEKKTEFFDEFHEDGEIEKDGEYHQTHESQKGGHEKSSHHEAKDHAGKYGKETKHEKGRHSHENKGHKIGEGLDNQYEHEESHGKKGAHDQGQKWAYEKDEGGGGGKKDGGGGSKTDGSKSHAGKGGDHESGR